MKLGSPQYQRMLDIATVALGFAVVAMVTVREYDHSHNDMLQYQRWAFKKVDSFFGVKKDELVAAGWVPKKPKHVEVGKKKGV